MTNLQYALILDAKRRLDEEREDQPLLKAVSILLSRVLELEVTSEEAT